MMNIGAQMRDNPLSLLLIGAGVGLMITRNMSSGYQGGMGMYRDDEHGDMMRRMSDPTAGYGSHEDERRGSAQGMMTKAQETISSQAQNVRDTMMETYSSATDRMSEIGERASEYTQRATSGLSTLATEQPLVLGALGLLAGAALAAMLPRTQLEEEYVTPTARQWRDQAASMASDTLERAKGAASKAADVITSEFTGEHDEQQGQKSSASGGPTQSASSKAQTGSARPTENISAGQGSSGGHG